MWEILGILILIWLGIGFVVGVKSIYLDGFMKTMHEKVDSGEVEFPEGTQHIYENVKNNKLFFLAFFTLFGLLSFIGDTRRTFSKK